MKDVTLYADQSVYKRCQLSLWNMNVQHYDDVTDREHLLII